MFRRVTGFVLLLCAFLSISVGLLPKTPAIVYAADFKVYADSSGIRIVSGEPVFGITNMAPGDSAGTSLEVENDSSESFILAISADIEEGDGPLYETLTITIGGDEGIYSGPLSGLREVRLGCFTAGSRHSYPMEIALPIDTDNRCQGMAVSIKFRLYSVPGGTPSFPISADPPGPDESSAGDYLTTPEDEMSGAGDISDPGLPVTGTNLDMLLPLGLVLFTIGLLLLSSSRRKEA